MARVLQAVHQPLAVSYYERLEAATTVADQGRLKVNAVLAEAEDAGLHRKAFKLGASLKRQDPVKTRVFLAAFDRIREDLELDAQQVLSFEREPAA